jgi:hypothetical protein
LLIGASGLLPRLNVLFNKRGGASGVRISSALNAKSNLRWSAMIKAVRRCAESPVQPEFSLCGDAFDAFESGDASESYELAKPGQSITCSMCCTAIREIKAIRNPLRPKKDSE